MSVRKFCSPRLPADHPLHCLKSPNCEHHWFYDFRVNRMRYRNTTETANKQDAKNIEARERSRVLDGRHQIRQQPDVTFKTFGNTYLTDYAEQHKRSVERDREILKVLGRAFGSLILHEITAHRIEQFKRERLTGKWRGHKHKGAEKPIQPGTVNRELDTLRGVFSKAVEWGYLVEHPMRRVKRLRVDNRRTRILTADEQSRLLAACPRKLGRMVTLALMTGARIGELLALRWVDLEAGELVFLETKNGRTRRLPIGPGLRAVFDAIPHTSSEWVFTNTRTHDRYTVNGVAHSFKRAVLRAGIGSGDVTLHTLRHTALSQMIAGGLDDYTVMEVSGHSSTRMLARYTHPTAERKVAALESFAPSMGRTWAEREFEGWKRSGGPQEDRTPDLRVANANGKKHKAP